MTELPAGLQEVLRPLLEQVKSLTDQIQKADVELEQIARAEYPETALLRQVKGVGLLIALTFVLTLDDHERFQKSRDAGCYVGLQPGRRNSGQSAAVPGAQSSLLRPLPNRHGASDHASTEP